MLQKLHAFESATGQMLTWLLVASGLVIIGIAVFSKSYALKAATLGYVMLP